MATAGLSFANPMMNSMDLGVSPNPYTPYSPTSGVGLDNLGPSLADAVAFASSGPSLSQFVQPKMQQPSGPARAYSPSTNKLYVNGVSFDADDYQALVESEKAQATPGIGLPQGGDWVPLDDVAYAQLLTAVKNPSLTQLASKNVGRGVDVLQMLAGRGMQLAGAEETGGKVVQQQMEDLRKTAPYERMFTDIDSADSAVEWFVANAAQQVPNIVMSAATAAVGSGIGAALGGAGARMTAGAVGQEAAKQGIFKAIAVRNAAGAAWKPLLKNALAKQASGAALLAPEAQAIAAHSVLSGAAKGAMIASFGENYLSGASDIYGAMRENGHDAQSSDARVAALLGGVPYAGLESASEVLGAARLAGAFAPGVIPKGTSLLKRGGILAGRAALGGGVGGFAEGMTEVGQDALTMGLSGQDLTSPKAQQQLINAFAGGFGIGAPLGGMANLRGKAMQEKKPVDLLGLPAPAEQLGLPAPEGYPQLPAPATPLGLPGPAPTLGLPYDQGVPPADGGSGGGMPDTFDEPPAAPMFNTQMAEQLQRVRRQSQEQQMQQQREQQAAAQREQELAILANQAANQQQVAAGDAFTSAYIAALNAGADDATARELANQYAQSVSDGTATEIPAQPRPVVPAQPQQQNLFGGLQQPTRAEKVAANQPLPTTVALPEGTTLFQPQQAPAVNRRAELETERRQLEVVVDAYTNKRVNKLTAKVRDAAQRRIKAIDKELAALPIEDRGVRQAAIQLPMFNADGNPTLPALLSATPKTPLPKVTPKPRATTTPGARGLKKQAISKGGVAEINILPAEPAVPPTEPPPTGGGKTSLKKSKGKKDAVQKQSATGVPVRQGTEAGKGVGQEVRGAEKPAGESKGEALKQGQQQKQKVATAEPAAASVTAATLDTGTAAEAWDDMDTGVVWGGLPAIYQKQWETSDRTQATADRIAADVRIDEAESGTAITDIEADFNDAAESTDRRDIKDALTSVVDAAYFLGEGTNEKPVATHARALLDSMTSSIENDIVNDIIIEMVNERQRIEAAYKSGAFKGQFKPWFTRLEAAGRVGELKAGGTVIVGLPLDTAKQLLDDGVLGVENLPADTQKKLGLSATAIKAQATPTTIKNVAKELADLLHAINTYTGTPYNNRTFNDKADKLKQLWQDVQAKGNADALELDGKPLAAYFTNGKPNIAKVGTSNKQTRVLTEEPTPDVLRKINKAIADEQAAKTAAGRKVSRSVADVIDDVDPYDYDYDSGVFGAYNRDDGTPITVPVAVGKIRLVVKAFLSKLRKQPTVHVYKNQADLKAKNPELYAKAVAGRPQGDFDTTSAVGYSFGDGQVVIFSDRVATEKQLKFVLAHETLGHFGFRGLMTEKELAVALDAVYNSSAKVRNAAKVAMESRGLSQREAVEEYLADFAGVLDTNILARFWNAVKNALNRLGLTFEDDMARYLVSQSRRYVRNGAPSSNMVSFAQMAGRIAAIERMEDPDGVGRFSVGSNLYSDTNRTAAIGAFDIRRFSWSDVHSWMSAVKGKGINAADMFDRVIGELKTMNFAARENMGYGALYEIMRLTNSDAALNNANYNKGLKATLGRAVEMFGKKWGSGTTQAETDRASELLRKANAAKLSVMDEHTLRQPEFKGLVTIVNGVPTIDQTKLAALKAHGRISFEEAKNGFTWTDTEWVPATEEHRNKLRAERDAALAKAVDDKERKAIERDYKARIEDTSMEVGVTHKYDGIADLTKESPEWVIYNEVRDTMDKAAIDLLLANFTSGQQARVNVERKAAQFLDRTLNAHDKVFLGKVVDKYVELYHQDAAIDADGRTTYNEKAQRNAEEFIKAFNTALLGLQTDLNAKVQEFFDTAQADDVFKGIEALKQGSKIQRSEDMKYVVQQAIANVVLAEENRGGAEAFAKQTIAGGYVPYGREGGWQIRIQAVDERGVVRKVSDRYRDKLFFAQVPTEADANAVAAHVQNVLDAVDGGFKMEVWEGGELVIRDVRLVAQKETARTTVSTASEANLNDVLNVLTRYSVSITPAERNKLVVGLTKQNASARRRLQRSGTPGEDIHTIKYVSQHLESTASTVSRKRHRHLIDRLFDESDRESKDLWYGNQAEYERRKAAWEAAEKDPAMSYEARTAARREFDAYHFTFVKHDSREQGNRYLDRGRRLVEFMDSQKHLDFTDFTSGEVAGAIKKWTTIAFMGAAPATAILNYVSLATNVLPAFAGYNNKNAFGGGFGWSKAAIELTRATEETKANGQSLVEYWDGLLADADKLKASGFTQTEAEFMRKEVGGGRMQAALTNAMMGSARGKFKTALRQKAVESFMFLFNYTEQHSRRATGLAAFRMAYERAIAEGQDAKTAAATAEQFAGDMLDNTLGEYAMYNRPAMFRGDVRQFLFMFKMFQVNTFQMLMALPRKEQLMALGILMAFSGLKGLPFAEDLMDILDTIAQRLGLGPGKLWRGSAERTLAEALDAIYPGLTPVALRGIVNALTPANAADRVGMGNMLPGSGMGLAGADVGRELMEIAGPAASFMQGAIASAGDTVKWGLGKTGLINQTTSITKIARESPVAAARMLGDLAAYYDNGAIVNQKGYVVSRDLTTATMLTRALGFYPSAAVRENDVVRMSTRVSDYQKDIGAAYRSMYVQAKLSGDNERAQRVMRQVQDWNANAKGTGLEIPNFGTSVNKALREAQRTASERYLRSAPKAMRQSTQSLINILDPDETN